MLKRTALLALAAAGVAVVPQSAAAPLQGTADLAITWSKTPHGATVQPGATVRYEVRIANRGPDASSNVGLEMGMVAAKAQIFSGAVSDGTRCTREDVISGLAYIVRCSFGTLGTGAAKTATIQVRALAGAGKTGGAIAVGAITASSTETVDPDDSNNVIIFGIDDEIQYSIVGRIGTGKSTARKIRARVLIAPEGSAQGSVAQYRRVEVFNTPPGASVELRAGSLVERGRTNSTGKLRSRRFVNRSFAVGTIFTVRVTKPGRIGDYLRIKVIAGGATLAGRQCIPRAGGAPRASCS